jgi:hypothetical protein
MANLHRQNPERGVAEAAAYTMYKERRCDGGGSDNEHYGLDLSAFDD